MVDKMAVDADADAVPVVDHDKEADKVGAAQAQLSPERVILHNFALINQAVDAFDPRFTLRALRSIATLRKADAFPHALLLAIRTAFPRASNNARRVLEETLPEDVRAAAAAEVNGHGGADKQDDEHVEKDVVEIAEVWAYLGVLVQVCLYDRAHYKQGATFSANFVEKIRSFNRRTMDPIAAKAYFYCSLFHEKLDPLPPSKHSPLTALRPTLLSALRSAVIRHDTETLASVTVLLLRNYIATADITLADLLVAQTQFPTTAANNQVCRYLYYLGRIRAIQLNYTEAHSHLEAAVRKSPTTGPAIGFYRQATKLLLVVELLMGDIPERSLFRQTALEMALHAYFQLVQAVRVGDLSAFLKCVKVHEDQFRADGTYTLILRLRQNVLKTGIRRLSLSYSRISLRDICTRLSIPSEESAEYITAKAIRDGVIEASLDHQNGHLVTSAAKDAYGTTEPSEAFHARIEALLGLRDECVRSMRFPGNGRWGREIEEVRVAREREREVVREIQEGDGEDDGGDDGGFDGI